ncbi:hypothetical protein Pla110_12160 [Polystyrenella longa]|uniref:Cysteine-rich secretory protein family protein n=1 Tax=Polystyrenella longa TaxID=2528007 RepID=A0A518CJU9_9PLAN|nr:hypothetical protein [Polystyrenella longa]QDU79506.1 hypothetical protein Pla110_12160 [Polystyrenella longa]
MIRPQFCFCFLLQSTVALIASTSLLSAAVESPTKAERIEPSSEFRQIGDLDWFTDYGDAYKEARDTNQQLLISFELNDATAQAEFEESVLASPQTQEHLENFVRAVLPLDATVPGEKQTLLWHASFNYMYKQAGIAILDLSDEKSPQYGQLVSALPFNHGRDCSVDELHTLVTLPEGTITQRTLIYALKRHPERPQSVNSTPHQYLMHMSNVNSSTMARLSQVGHHNWTARFHQINSTVGGLSTEVAVGGNGYTLLDIANDCIGTWRSSAGHWNAMRKQHRYYGYDMVQGSNGTWYATGVFAD